MSWWRRDPSLWCRSPIHRYSRRVLRDHEAVLRSRSFSKGQTCAAQHKYDEDAKRPDGLSDLEWLQLQHYRRWKRRLQDDPYRALFGASNDMLSGKGLKDWTWVYKTFPRWIIKEMELPDYPEDPKRKESPPSKDGSNANEAQPTSGRYPRKVDITNEDQLKPRESVFEQPSYKKSQFERSAYSSGIQSPSDSRRPRDLNVSEQPADIEQPGKPRGTFAADHIQALAKSRSTDVPAKGETARELQKDAASRETDFITEFLADKPGYMVDKSPDVGNWRQTALSRRAALGMASFPDKEGKGASDRSVVVPSASKEPSPVPSTQSTLEPDPSVPWHVESHHSLPQANTVDDISSVPAVPQGRPGTRLPRIGSVGISAGSISGATKPNSYASYLSSDHENPSLDATKSKSTQDVLRQLPDDDVDFLSAEEIRASMGVKKSNKESTEEKQKMRAQLEESFRDSQKKDLDLDPILKGQVVGDQYMRRTKRELLEKVKPKASDVPTIVGLAGITETPIETSLDRMTKWLQTSGDTFAKHFWAEPVSAREAQANGKKPPDHLLKSFINGQQAARKAMQSVYDDLPKDLPASSQLLERLESGQKMTLTTIGTLLRPSRHAGSLESWMASKDRPIKIMRDIARTRSEFRVACEALENPSEEQTESYSKTLSEAAKSRMRYSLLVLEKNTKLTRTMIQALQIKLGTNELNWPLSFYQVLLDRFLALQDTQYALLRLVERSFQHHNIERNPPEQSTPSSTPEPLTTPALEAPLETPNPGTDSAATLKRNLAADERLNAEIEAQKFAMRGLSDDGYARAPKPLRRKTFDDSSPLSHSLFRPFGLQLESLGKEEEAPQKPVDQAAKDKALVQEIKKSYEDVYGPITVDHRQVEEGKEVTAESEQMLEDKVQLEEPTVSALEVNSPKEILATDRSQGDAAQATSDIQEAKKEDKTHGFQGIFASDRSHAIEQPSKSAADVAQETTTPDHTSAQVTQASEEQIVKPTEEEAPSSFVSAAERVKEEEELSKQLPASSAQTIEELEGSRPLKSMYRVIVYDTFTDNISEIITSSTPSATANTTIPMHEALASLDKPARFMEYLDGNEEIVTVKPNLLVLREYEDSVDDDEFHSSESDLRDEGWSHTNPVDGTTRLSPTGFNGVEPDLRDEVPRHDQDLSPDAEMAKVRKTARKQIAALWKDEDPSFDITEKDDAEEKKAERSERKKRGGVASVFRTAIVASAVCYVAGVVGELFR